MGRLFFFDGKLSSRENLSKVGSGGVAERHTHFRYSRCTADLILNFNPPQGWLFAAPLDKVKNFFTLPSLKRSVEYCILNKKRPSLGTAFIRFMVADRYRLAA